MAKFKQKEEERIVGEVFLSRIDRPYLQIQSMPEPPEPDVVLFDKLTKNQIGLELTSLRRKKRSDEAFHPFKEIGLQEKILETGAELFYKKYGYHLECHFDFGAIKIPKKQIKEFIEPIADLIHTEIYLLLGEKSSLQKVTIRRLLPKEIHSIQVFFLPSFTQSFWTSGSADWLSNISHDVISDRIATKEERLVKYHQNYQENWLLIYEPVKKGGMFYNYHLLDQVIFTTKFDKVYVLPVSSHSIVCLNLK